MQTIEALSAPAIATAVYVAIELLKHLTGGSSALKKWYPASAAVLGTRLGLLAYLGGWADERATGALGAIAVGFCSGLTATGTDQLIKKMLRQRARQASCETESAKTDGAAPHTSSSPEGRE